MLRNDEIGAVAQGLNEMLAEMEGVNVSLQERIREATSELRGKNEELVESYQRVFALREALARADQMAAVGHMAASVAHQVGTPLNLISGYVQMIREDEGVDSRVTRRLEIVQEQIAKVTSVVRTMLDHARRPMPKEPTDLAELLRRVCDVARPKLDALGVRLDLSAEAVPPVMADAVQLELALLNLVTNSLDAMSSGGVMSISARERRRRPRPDPGGGHRDGHRARAAAPDLRAVGDHQGGRPRHRPRPQHHARRAGEPRRHDHGDERGGRRLGVHHRSAGGARHSGRMKPRPHDGSGSGLKAQAEGGNAEGTMPRILIVDDDHETCRFMADLLARPDREIESAYDPKTALALVRAQAFDLVISDINLNAEHSGLDVLRAFRESSPRGHVLLISGFGTLETAIDAVRAGAFDYISKPFNISEVKATVERALTQTGAPASQAAAPARGVRPPGLLGRTAPMLAVYKQIAHAADAAVPVLIVGESGTGKELVARAIHSHGRRAQRPFVPVNCGAIAESLLESELFGHVRGSFTGAVSDTKGIFEQANGGTVFLDEIGETSPALQVKLLRVLEEGELRAVGASRADTVDVRVVAATNVDLEKEVARAAVPPGPVLPPQRHRHPRAAAARAPGRHPAARRPVPPERVHPRRAARSSSRRPRSTR